MLKDKQVRFKKRVASICYPFFVILIPLIFSPALHSAAATQAAKTNIKVSPEKLLESSLVEVKSIAESGATSLALKIIDDRQASYSEKPYIDKWLEWEKLRITILELGKHWNSLQMRVANYKNDLPRSFQNWSRQKQVNALIKLKHGKQARKIIREIIWQTDETISVETLSEWQRKIIESYLVENLKQDALFAMQRYYQDYTGNDIKDRLLRARILLMNERNEEVVGLLENDTRHPQGAMLYLLAQLRSKERAPRKVLQSALRQMRGEWASEELRYTLWAVVAESAKLSLDKPSTVNALEFVIAGNKQVELPVGLFNFSAKDLWDSYLDYALHIGNKSQFLIGNDQQWLKAAKKAEVKYPVRARSLYALVILRGQDELAQLQAARGFLDLMRKRKRGATLMLKLFINSEQFQSISTIPVSIRYDLVNVALSRSDISLASDLMATIRVAPEGVEDFQWQLRRARILILGGKIKYGVQSLESLISSSTGLMSEQVDQILQVIFDLQTIKEHRYAYQLFRQILPRVTRAKTQREIFFWMAESLKAEQEYVEASHLYLRSAFHLDKQPQKGNQKGLDPWGQTARYQAAEMLSRAGLYKDAGILFEQLLKVTRDPARRAVLKHEIQKLWLLRNNQDY